MDQSYAYTPQIWLSVLSVLFLFGLAFLALRHRHVAGAVPFAIACLFSTLWAACSVLEYSAVDFATKLFWFKAQVFFKLPATTAITCFVLEYAWPGRWLTRRNLVLLSIVPLAAIGVTLTDNLNHLMWIGFEYGQSVVPQLNLAGKFFIAYAIGLGILNILVFLWLFVRSPEHRWPVLIMAFGQVVTRVLYVLEVDQIVRTDLPLDMFGIVFTFLMYIIALFGFHLLDPIPLAMQMVITQMCDGMLVLDSEGKLTNMNPAAQKILACTKKRCLRKPILELMPDYQEEISSLLTGNLAQTEIHIEQNQQDFYYVLQVSAIKDWHEVELGHLLLLRDITSEKHAQAKIIEQQRSLATLKERSRIARDLHDNLGQVVAFVNTQGQAIRRLLSQGDISSADAQVARLVEAAQEADMDIRESLLGLRVAISEQGFFPALSQYLAQYEKNYAIQTKLIKPTYLEECRLDPQVETQLLGILQEALTNARKHAKAHNIEVKFEPGLGWTNVTIKDDGQGFDTNTLSNASGEHIGLRVMRERAEEIGSSLSLHSEPGHGTQVVVRVPLKLGGNNA